MFGAPAILFFPLLKDLARLNIMAQAETSKIQGPLQLLTVDVDAIMVNQTETLAFVKGIIIYARVINQFCLTV